MNDQLNIVNIIDMLLRRWTIVLLTTIIVGVFSFVYSEVFVSPVYSSDASLYVYSENQKKMTDEISQATINSSRQLVATYTEILSTRTFLDKVAEDMEGKYTATQLGKMITLDAKNETEILSITVKGNNAEDVYNITRFIVKRAPDQLKQVFASSYISVLDDASETTEPISPNIRRNTFIGVLIGIILGAFIVIILELFDTRIKGGDEITQRYKEPLLGEIPSLLTNTQGTQSYGYGQYSDSGKEA